MNINLTSSADFPATAGVVDRGAVKEFIDALPADAKLEFRTYLENQREQTSGGVSITAKWAEER